MSTGETGGAVGPVEAVGAIVLTGGRASRLGGIDKASLQVSGREMVETVRGAAAAVAGRVVTVGPESDVRENPPFSGPVAGIAAGLAVLPEGVEIVVVVACDLPDLDDATLSALIDAARDPSPRSGPAAALAVDADGRDQYLLAAWDRHTLASRLADLRAPRRNGPGGSSGADGASLAGLSVRALYDDDEIVFRRVPVGDSARDVDTWAELAARGPVAIAHVSAVLAAAIPPLPPVDRPPLTAIGSVLAAPLVAVDPMPRGPVSAMDGYALAGPGPWRLTGVERRAGDASAAELAAGTAAVIATGALAPAGTDRVLRHELVTVHDAESLVTALPDADGVNDLRPVGEDWPAGHVLAPAGTELDAALASAALSGGLAEVSVRGPVRATVVTTGDEVLPADSPSPLPEGRIRDTVGPLLAGVLARAGFAGEAGVATGPVRHCPDTAEELEILLRGDAGASADGPAHPERAHVLVLVGATGRGVADLLRPALARVGGQIVLDGVRVRPGGSQLVALLPDGRVLLGLPGNPLAAVAAAATTGRALVEALTGRTRTPTIAQVERVGALSHPSRSRILPARPDGAGGGWTVTERVRTAHLADLAGAPALAVIPEAARDDDPVELLDWM